MITISTLNNGLRVVTDTMNEAESVVVGTWVGVGTRHEPWNANGVAHLVEHMMFKGTKKRSAYALSAAIERNGGAINAHTTREETAYYARVLPEDTGLAVDIIADMLQNSIHDPKELEREKQVIIQEIGRDLDSPEDHIFDVMYGLAFPKQKIGRPILGSVETISKLQRPAITNYVKSYYHAGNMVLVAAGKIEHAHFLRLAEKHFSNMPRGRAPVREKAKICSGDRLIPKTIAQLHLILGFGSPGFYDRGFYATQLLSILLGGSSSSRLFQKVREKRGLVYTISSGHATFSDAGIFQIYAGTDPQRARELIPVVCSELRDVVHRVTAGELARAKAQSRADLLMGQENVMGRAHMLGHQMLAFGKPLVIQNVLDKLMKITREDVQAVAARLFTRNPILTALGPLDELESYNEIAARLDNITFGR